MGSRRRNPHWEQERDRIIAREVMAAVAPCWGWDVEETPIMCHADFIAYEKQKPVALIEVKARTNRFNKYPTFMIGYDKWEGLREMSAAHGVPAILVVRFTDCYAHHKLTPMPHRLGMGGRTDRNDPADIDLQAYTPMKAFERIPKTAFKQV